MIGTLCAEVVRMPHPREMDLLMRGKLLTWGRTLSGNLWKKVTRGGAYGGGGAEEGFSEGEEEIIGKEDPKGDPKGDPEQDPEEEPEENPEEDLVGDRAELIHEGYIGEELEDPRAESGVPEVKGVSKRVR